MVTLKGLTMSFRNYMKEGQKLLMTRFSNNNTGQENYEFMFLEQLRMERLQNRCRIYLKVTVYA